MNANDDRSGPESAGAGPGGEGSQQQRWVEGDLEAGADPTDGGGAGQSGAGRGPDLAADLRALGENLRDALRTAWSSQERERIQSEIEGGLRQLRQALGQTFEEGKSGLRSERVRERMAGVRDDLRSRPLGDRVRNELHDLLARLNEEVRHSRERWTPRGGAAADDAAAREEPPADETRR